VPWLTQSQVVDFWNSGTSMFINDSPINDASAGLPGSQPADMPSIRSLRVNNEFHVAPTYNQLIAEGTRIIIMKTGRGLQGMYGVGTLENLESFQKNRILAQERHLT
jgi:hypothetical protein